MAWVGLLFAVLASGVQYSDDAFHDRQPKSQFYGMEQHPSVLHVANFAIAVRYSFECLRMANFLVRPSLLCIQTSLILGNVLQNDMKPETAWMLLGTTARMAQSLGLHEEQNSLSSPGQKIWYVEHPLILTVPSFLTYYRLAIVWQDSLLSLCFDRPPVTAPSATGPQLSDEMSYVDAMYSLCDITLTA